ncbi:MAG: hypothetical protein OYH77_08500 [Pseudomonadota bacterium]|nr:hypothetical protein [Pseudomonadota bacterium]
MISNVVSSVVALMLVMASPLLADGISLEEPEVVTCSCEDSGSCDSEGCSHHEHHDASYRQLLGATQAVVVSSAALSKITGDLSPRYDRTHVPASRIHRTSLTLVGTLMSQHDNCGRWKVVVDLVNHKMKELMRGYKLDHATWKNPQVEHGFDTVSKDHAMFASTFNSYFADNECVPNTVGGKQ